MGFAAGCYMARTPERVSLQPDAVTLRVEAITSALFRYRLVVKVRFTDAVDSF